MEISLREYLQTSLKGGGGGKLLVMEFLYRKNTLILLINTSLLHLPSKLLILEGVLIVILLEKALMPAVLMIKLGRGSLRCLLCPPHLWHQQSQVFHHHLGIYFDCLDFCSFLNDVFQFQPVSQISQLFYKKNKFIIQFLQ